MSVKYFEKLKKNPLKENGLKGVFCYNMHLLRPAITGHFIFFYTLLPSV